MCSETSEAVGTIWEHAQKEFQKFLKIRITLLVNISIDRPISAIPRPAHPSNNPTPTFCTLPRDSKACEVILQSHLSEDEIPQATRVRGVRPRSNDIIVYKMS